MRLFGYYFDADELLEGMLIGLCVWIVLDWAGATGGSGGPYTTQSQGEAPVLLTARSLEHLEDGGTIEVDRWHGGTLHLEGYQTADVDGGAEG